MVKLEAPTQNGSVLLTIYDDTGFKRMDHEWLDIEGVRVLIAQLRTREETMVRMAEEEHLRQLKLKGLR